MTRIIFAALALMATMAAAGAADFGAKAGPHPIATNWTGCYLGAGAGYGMANLRVSARSATTGATFDRGHDNSASGMLGTIGGGCDYQLASRWVFGGFGDFDWTGMKGDLSYNCPGGCAGPTGFV